jgi:xanthosine utilization system XapX-like protein
MDIDQPFLVIIGWIGLLMLGLMAVIAALIVGVVFVWNLVFPPDPNVVCIRHEQVPMMVGKSVVMVDHCVETGRIVR